MHSAGPAMAEQGAVGGADDVLAVGAEEFAG